MSMERVEVTRQLRQLIKMQRTDRAKLTQRAAAESVGLSEIWWRQVEGGHVDYVLSETLARMCHAVAVTPRQLHRIGQDHIADLVHDRDSMLGPTDSLEDFLMKTPELTDAQRVALITMAKVLRDGA